MTSLNKKKKCNNTLLTCGGEKGRRRKWKGFEMYHKKDRVANKKECKEE